MQVRSIAQTSVLGVFLLFLAKTPQKESRSFLGGNMSKKVIPIEPRTWDLSELKKSGYGHQSRYLNTDPLVGLDEMTLLGYLNSYAGDKGECWPKRDKTILRELHWGRVKYDNALRTLKEAGYVSTSWAKRQGYRVYLFSLLEPEKGQKFPSKIKETDLEHPKYKGLDRHGFGYVYKCFSTASYLSGGAKGMLFYLLSRMGRTAETRLDYSTIKYQLNIKNDKTIHTYLKELIAIGLIKTEKIRKEGKFHKIRFIFVAAIKSQNNLIANVTPVFFAKSPGAEKNTSKISTGKIQSDNKTSSPVKDKPTPSVYIPLGLSQSIKGAARQTEIKKSRCEFWTYQPKDSDNTHEVLTWQNEQPQKIASQINALCNWQTAIQVISKQTGIAIADTTALTRCIDYDIFQILSHRRTIPVELVQDPQVTRRVVRVLTKYRCNDDIKSVPGKCELSGDIEDALTRLLNETKTEEFFQKFCDVVFCRRTKAVHIMHRLFDHLYANIKGRQDIKRRAAYIRHSVINFFAEYDTPWSEIPYKKEANETYDIIQNNQERLPTRYDDFIRTMKMQKYLPNILLLPTEEFSERAAAYEALSQDARDGIFTSSELDWIWYVIPSDYSSFVSEYLCEADQQSVRSLSANEYKRCKRAYETMSSIERCDIWDGDHDWMLGDIGMNTYSVQKAI